jgi:uncharacterized protein
MDLKRRLSQRRAIEAEVEASQPPPPPPPAAPSKDEEHAARVARLRGMLDALISRQNARWRDEPAARSRPAQALPGSERDTPLGKVHVISEILEPNHCHGRVAVARALAAKAEIISRLALDKELGTIDPRRLLYIDTESTGLNGGTGTVPFLIGLAWFSDESLTIEQFLLRRPGEEAPMLALLAERMRSASCIVSYNGKSYDLPLLQSRFVMSRLEPPPVLPHLDLLHCARRVFRRRLGEVRLVTIEQRLLGFRREYDVDGHEIPGLYWSAVRGDPSTLSPIIEHNRNDVIALSAILGILADRYERLHREDDPSDHLGLAKVAARALDTDRAMQFAEAAAEGGGDSDLTVDALVLSARLARGREDYEAARVALERALATATSSLAISAIHLALAKLFEHRLSDLSRALEHARFTSDAEGEEAHEKRVKRLDKKLNPLR